MSGFRNYSLTKNGQLTIGQIFSPDFLAGVSGWTINKDGSAEFNNLTIRGTFLGLDFEITTAGAFFYSGTPAAGNLIVSIAAAAGTDGYGNSYPSGIASMNGGITVNLTNGTLTLTPVTGGHTPAELSAFTGVLFANSPAETSGDAQSQLSLYSKTAALASSPSQSALQVTDGVDGQVYSAQRLTKVLAGNTGTLTSLTTVFSATVGARTYRVHAQLYVNATSGAEFTVELVVPATASGQLGYTISRGTTFVAAVTGGVNSSVGAAVSLGTNTYLVTLDATIATTGSGTFDLQCGSLTGTGLVIAAQSFIDIMPV